MIINLVLTPIIRKELPELLEWIAHCPRPGYAATFMFSIDDSWRPEEKLTVMEAFDSSQLKEANIHFIDCKIPVEQSFYQKTKNIIDFDAKTYPYGLKSGPNLQFFNSLNIFRMRQI